MEINPNMAPEDGAKGGKFPRFPADRIYVVEQTFGRGSSAAVDGFGTNRGDSGGTRHSVMSLPSLLSRVIPASYFTIVSYGFWLNFTQTGKWTSLLWVVSEGIAVILLVIRRPSRRISRSPWDWFVAFGGSFTILLVRPTTAAFIPDFAGVALQLAGTLFQLYGKVHLGRSFGIVPADRGIVTGGPYRIVRHPIYLGYVITHIGFLLANWSPRNLAVYFFEYIFQIARILSEEQLLKESPEYRAYCADVRYRMIPLLF